MDPIAQNPATVQFIRKRNSAGRTVAAVFLATLVLGALLVAFAHPDSIETNSDQSQIFFQDVPSNAQSLVRSEQVLIKDLDFIRIPGVSLVPVAAWKEQVQDGSRVAQLFSAPQSAEDFSRALEISAGLSGFGLSARRIDARQISYTFYRGGKSGDILIVPESASSSRIIIKL